MRCTEIRLDLEIYTEVSHCHRDVFFAVDTHMNGQLSIALSMESDWGWVTIHDDCQYAWSYP